MSGLEMLGLGAGAVGTGLSAAGTIMGANQQASALERQRPIDLITGQYRAQALKYAADEARAAGQQSAIAQTTQKDLALSKAQSVAAASGGGASDPTVVNLEAGIERQGEYYKLMDLYSGENRARGLETEAQNALIGGYNKANADQYAADTTRSNARWQAASTLLGGAKTMFEKYGQGQLLKTQQQIDAYDAQAKGYQKLSDETLAEIRRKNAAIDNFNWRW